MNTNTDIRTRHGVELRAVVLYRSKMIDGFLLNAKRLVPQEEIENLMLKKSGLKG